MIPAWAKALIVVGIVAGIFQTGRVYEQRISQRDAAVATAAQTKKDAAAKIASANQKTSAATAGAKTVTNYADRIEAERPAVERVVTRVRNVCMREQLPGAGNPVSVPKGAGAVQAAGSEAGNSREREADRQFVEALERDINVCAAELKRLDESARYLRIQDGEE